MAASRGRYLVFLDDDDELEFSFLRRTYNFYLKESKNFDFSWSSVEFIDYIDGNTSVRKHEWPDILKSDKYIVEKAMRIGLGYGLVIKRSLYEEIGGLNRIFKTSEDTEFIARLLANGFRPAEVKDATVFVHNHNDDRLTQNAESITERIYECKMILDLYEDFFNEYFHCKSALHWYIEQLQLNNKPFLNLDAPQ